ncbi:hypothetical protein ARMGADRAFT_57233 [Armillaria gallica]|uniref:Uncharacterized protein n=1 Tax=Armillaria gallica TaxID=47427 RepID=A0A2H3EAW9_ARMGA|nr:hypothetical protein ARMGADRAFT_57233 [Armillaria gallica]
MLPCAGTQFYRAEIRWHPFSQILNSWIAQASTLGCDEEELCLITDTEFTLDVGLETYYGSFRLCDTFMCEDPHILSLSISAPSLDYQTNKVSCPVFTWYDMGSEMSLVEVEVVFGVTVCIWGGLGKLCGTQRMLTTIPELNTDYGFDPTCGGADVCEYFGWPLMEILDVSTGGRKICVCCVYNH